MDLSVRAYAINVDLKYSVKKEEPPQRHLQEKRKNHVGFVMKR